MLQELLRFVGYGVCHQLPERSFFAGDLQFPVCTRDTGTFLGFVVAYALLLYLGRRRRPVDFPPPWAMAVVGVLFLTWLFDGASSYLGFRETTNLIRFATGLASGFALAAIITPVMNELMFPDPRYGERVLGSAREVVWYLVALVVTFAVGWWALPLLGPVWAFLSAVTIIATFVVVNLGIVHLFKRFAGRIQRAPDLAVPVLIALILTVVELLIVSGTKAGLT